MSKSEHEEFVSNLLKHISETLEHWEVDNNLLLSFKCEIDLQHGRTLKFDVVEQVVEGREPLKLKEVDND